MVVCDQLSLCVIFSQPLLNIMDTPMFDRWGPAVAFYSRTVGKRCPSN